MSYSQLQVVSCRVEFHRLWHWAVTLGHSLGIMGWNNWHSWWAMVKLHISCPTRYSLNPRQISMVETDNHNISVGKFSPECVSNWEDPKAWMFELDGCLGRGAAFPHPSLIETVTWIVSDIVTFEQKDTQKDKHYIRTHVHWQDPTHSIQSPWPKACQALWITCYESPATNCQGNGRTDQHDS